MKTNRPLKTLFFLFAALFVLACTCNGGNLLATATPVPTNTPVATNTLPPTKIPESTETPVPEFPTPSPLGSIVQSASFEVQVLGAEKRDRVYPGGTLLYTPADGYMLVDIGIKVKNLTGSSLSVKWSDIYIMNANQDWWYSSFGTFKDTDKILDPLTIGVSENEVDPEAQISFSQDGYLRLFYHIPAGETYYFGFSDSPLTEINFK